jgi:hypothetical protein
MAAAGPGRFLPPAAWRQGALRRAIFAGAAWGIPMAACIIALDVRRCGMLCVTDAAVTLALATAAGTLTIGVFAACFGGTARGLLSRRNITQERTPCLAPSS